MANKSLTLAVATSVWLLGTLPAPAAAPCMLCAPAPQAAQKPPAAPITVQIDTSIDFARIGLIRANQGGIAAINPDTGQRTLQGQLIDLGGMPVQGTVTIRGEPNEQVLVTLPTQITLTSAGGGTLELSKLTSTLKPNPKLDKDGTLVFSFGGELRIDGAATGDFRGRVPITVDYR
jgi:hypothetical protein